METKRKIMSSAFTLFATKGSSFSLTEVAKEVGIKKASIYAHFENKDRLLHDVIEQEIKYYFFEINQEKDDLKKIFFGVLDYYNDSQIKLLFWKRLLLFPPESLEATLLDKIHQMAEERYQVVKSLIQREIKAGIIKAESDEEVAMLYFSLIHGLLSSVLIYHPLKIKQHYNNMWDIFWKGLS